MKRTRIALPLLAAALLGLTGCTSYPGSDEVAAQYHAEVKAQGAGTTGEDGGSDEHASPAPDQDVPGGVEDSAAIPGDSAALEPQEGVYFRAHQAFNPTLARWDVTGTEFEYESVTCLGKTAAFGSGTLVPTGDAGNYKITWSPDSDEVKHLDTRVTVTDKTFGPAGNADDTASTNKEVQMKLFTEMCGELGDTVLGFIS